MSVETNKTNFANIPLEIYNTRDVTKIDQYFAEDYVERAPLPPDWPTGRDSVRAYFTELFNAFPDLQATVEQVLGDGDELVAGRITVQGTHLGSYLGIPATGKVINWTESHFGRMRNGKLVEHWADFDQFGMLQQMGVIPDMQQAPQPSTAKVQ